MSDPTPPHEAEALAREALALAEKASLAPWTHGGDWPQASIVYSECMPVIWCNPLDAEPGKWDRPPRSVGARANAALIAHAGTHYATLARALLSALASPPAWITIRSESDLPPTTAPKMLAESESGRHYLMNGRTLRHAWKPRRIARYMPWPSAPGLEGR